MQMIQPLSFNGMIWSDPISKCMSIYTEHMKLIHKLEFQYLQIFIQMSKADKYDSFG